jgi:hypothetical protein
VKEKMLAATSADIRDYAERLEAPSCGSQAVAESREWFETDQPPASFAFLPLRGANTFGLLALASPDPARFQQDVRVVFGFLAGQRRARGTERGHLDDLVPEEHMCQAEAPPDQAAIAEQPLHFFRPCAGGDVEVLGRHAYHQVAQAATDKEGLVTPFPGSGGGRSDARRAE